MATRPPKLPPLPPSTYPPPPPPPQKPLQEKDFIQDSLRKNPFPFWLWLFILTALMSLFWGISNSYKGFINQEVAQSPFLQVTNRQFSLFLWQFPEYMRINAYAKSNYLTGFQYNDKVTLILEDADKYVVAPPETIFLYQTWDRLISTEFASRPIPASEFKQFLSEVPEWTPSGWPQAPKGYVEFIQTLTSHSEASNLGILPESNLPMVVRQAFQGWKNYFKEGDAINNAKFTPDEVRNFLKLYPHYARPYWRNIMLNNYPRYLEFTIEPAAENAKGTVADDEIAPFLRVALYNYKQAQKSFVESTSHE
jgi:hypothetical protein